MDKQPVVTAAHLVLGAYPPKDKGDLLHLRRAIHLPRSVIPADKEAWQIRACISRARTFAAVYSCDDPRSVIVTGEAALQLRGLPTWWNSVDIHLRRIKGSVDTRRRDMAEVRVGDTVCRSVVIKEVISRRVGLLGISDVTGAITSEPSPEEIRGVQVAQISEAVFDVCRINHKAAAFVDMCLALNAVTGFDKFNSIRSRAAERKAKNNLMSLLMEVEPFRKQKLTQCMVENADTGVESPGEGYVLWLLLCSISRLKKPHKSGNNLIFWHLACVLGQ